MEKIKMYQVDAFTDKLFSGNPAAVCLPEKWINDDLMQSIAAENNLAETAFIVPDGKDYEIRWFTPTTEVDLCGHATLASAFVLFDVLHYPDSIIRFHSAKSGLLSVSKNEGMLFLDFPTDVLELAKEVEKIAVENSLGIKVAELYKGRTDYLAVIDSEEYLINLQPDFTKISLLKARGLIVAARGNTVDFVSRFFAPQSGINEDPVTGSAHTTLLPYWSKKLDKNKLIARQLSKRGGQLFCEYKNERCSIGGKARLYLTGEIIME